MYFHSLLQYNAIQYDTIRYDTIRYDTIRYDTSNDTIRYNTICDQVMECNVTCVMQCNTVKTSWYCRLQCIALQLAHCLALCHYNALHCILYSFVSYILSYNLSHCRVYMYTIFILNSSLHLFIISFIFITTGI